MDEKQGSETIAAFCDAENLSKSSYYELQKRGLGPEELRPPGTKIIRITPEAHASGASVCLSWLEPKRLSSRLREGASWPRSPVVSRLSSPRHISRRRANQHRHKQKATGAAHEHPAQEAPRRGRPSSASLVLEEAERRLRSSDSARHISRGRESFLAGLSDWLRNTHPNARSMVAKTIGDHLRENAKVRDLLPDTWLRRS